MLGITSTYAIDVVHDGAFSVAHIYFWRQQIFCATVEHRNIRNMNIPFQVFGLLKLMQTDENEYQTINKILHIHIMQNLQSIRGFIIQSSVWTLSAMYPEIYTSETTMHHCATMYTHTQNDDNASQPLCSAVVLWQTLPKCWRYDNDILYAQRTFSVSGTSYAWLGEHLRLVRLRYVQHKIIHSIVRRLCTTWCTRDVLLQSTEIEVLLQLNLYVTLKV